MVTLVEVRCICGKVCAYHIRAGINHHSTEARDPYTCSGAISLVDGEWIIGPLSGEIPPGFVRELRTALAAVGVEKVKWEHLGKLAECGVMKQSEGR